MPVVVYLVTDENLNILRKLNNIARDAIVHWALLPAYRRGMIQRTSNRPNQSNRVIHSMKYDCLSLENRRQNQVLIMSKNIVKVWNNFIFRVKQKILRLRLIHSTQLRSLVMCYPPSPIPLPVAGYLGKEVAQKLTKIPWKWLNIHK